MALTAHYLLMGVFILILLSIAITGILIARRKITLEAACLTPILLLCFVYTPASWFTFDGLLGCTPFLSILFIVVIVLTYYQKIQAIVLSLYAVMLAGLTIHWLLTMQSEYRTDHVINVLLAYVLTSVLVFLMTEGVKRKNYEINQKIAELSIHDDLTELFNRRAIGQVFNDLEPLYMKTQSDYAAVILDVDRFKSINDLYGHNLGDAVLKTLAVCITNSIRAQDFAFRLGGDEFLVVLPDADEALTRQICDRIKTALKDVHGYAFPVTASVGMAMRSQCPNTTELLDLADKRMYQDKNGLADRAKQILI